MLSEYGVAMAAASLAHGRSNENDAPQVPRIRPHVRKSRSSRVRQTECNEKQLRRTKPVATCAVTLARLKQDSTHCLGELWLGEFVHLQNRLLRCVTKQLVPTDARRLARHLTYVRRGAGIELLTPSSTRIILKIPNAPGSDEASGVRCTLCHV